MKTILFWILLAPFLVFSQSDQSNENEEYLVVGTTVFAPKPGHMDDFKQGMKAHNEQFHNGGDWGVRIYNIMNGPNTDKMMAVMGPFQWSTLDKPRENAEAHSEDWDKNVVPYMQEDLNSTYWRFHHDLSNFPPNFDVNKLEIVMFDINRMEGERMKKELAKVTKVFKEKYPDMPYGIYTNEFAATNDGRDMAIAYFFDHFKWLSKDFKFKENYNAVHGEGTYDKFMQEWKDITAGAQTEIWVFNQALSGIGSQVTTGSRVEE
ncbi:hypothetical protein [Salegentibacter chungangensis]|uniref:Uncharacterized protein n=1 Tax=Salegentibacter chungangensis TaxID=1335724 RepID=A0ABW3NR70_9FLAO